jgi:hypothetical protein
MGLLQPAHGSPTPLGSDRPAKKTIEKKLLEILCLTLNQWVVSVEIRERKIIIISLCVYVDRLDAQS